jgi:hypothetical protein
MSDKFITVATFNKTFEAQLAKNLLESEGIESIVGGAFSSDVLFGSIACRGSDCLAGAGRGRPTSGRCSLCCGSGTARRRLGGPSRIGDRCVDLFHLRRADQ